MTHSTRITISNLKYRSDRIILPCVHLLPVADVCYLHPEGSTIVLTSREDGLSIALGLGL